MRGFSPMAQGMLSSRYLGGIPDDSRVGLGGSLRRSFLCGDDLARIRALDGIATRRSQSLAQTALAWVLKDRRIPSVVIGASRSAQVEDGVRALEHADFTAKELAEIDRHAMGGGIDPWTRSRQA